MAVTALPVVGVMGSGRAPHAARSCPLGEWIARAGGHLLTGGGAGVMAAVTEAFARVTPRAGVAIGILPAGPEGSGDPPPGYPNVWVEVVIRTHLDQRGPAGDGAASRNHLNVLSSDVLVILPGSAGTASEAALAVRYRRPAIAYLDRREDVPDLPPSVPVVSRLAEVRRFVRRCCRDAGKPLAVG